MNARGKQPTDDGLERESRTANQGGPASATGTDTAPPAPGAAPPTSQTAESGGNAGTGAAAPPEAECAALRVEIDELRDRNLRLLAEVQNAAKRAEREKQEALRYAEADFARDLLIVLDDLERTLEAARTAVDPQKLAEGVRIVYEHFLKVLRSRGIEPVEATGRPFDPAQHEALLQQPSDEHPPGTVVQEVARGYKMRERVLRPARVIVSTGGSSASKAASQEEPD